MATGKIVRFDPAKGHGFIEPDDGGSLVFVNADDFGGVWDLQAGTLVRFSSIQGTRGPKAYNVRILTRPSEKRARFRTSGDLNDGNVTRYCHDGNGASIEYQMISRRKYAEEITEVLTSQVPGITAAQVSNVCRKLTKRAIKHSWLETLS